MLSWPIFGVFTYSLQSRPTRLIYMGAGAESWSFVKFMLNFFRAGAEKSAIQLNGIAQGREIA